MNIRLAAAADIPAMIALERGCESAAHWTEGQYRSALPACGAGLTSRLMLVVYEDEPALTKGDLRCAPLAGFLVARRAGPEWEIENIAIASPSRRNGVGTALVQELLGRAQAVGSESVHLEVRASNQAARSFYKKLGFEESGRRKGYYAGPVEDAVLYRRILNGTRSQNRT